MKFKGIERFELVFVITILAWIIVTLSASFLANIYLVSPVVRLERKLDDLRSSGVPIEFVGFDDEIGLNFVYQFLHYPTIEWKLPAWHTQPSGFFPQAFFFVLDVVFV